MRHTHWPPAPRAGIPGCLPVTEAAPHVIVTVIVLVLVTVIAPP